MAGTAAFLEQYKAEYVKLMNECMSRPAGVSAPALFVSPEFDLQKAHEFVRLYEGEYPGQARAFKKFFRKMGEDFPEHRTKIKCMTYMLEERLVRRITEWMDKSGGIYVKLFHESSPKGADAFFGWNMLGRPRIMFYDIEGKERNIPPYKTFFHELGHALDGLSAGGRRYYSDTFKSRQEADKRILVYDAASEDYGISSVKVCCERSIHEWAEFDLENLLIKSAYEMLKGRAGQAGRRSYRSLRITARMQYEVAVYVIYRLLLCWDGAAKAENLSETAYPEAVRDLYDDLRYEVTKIKLRPPGTSPVLPGDLFGGLTNNQVGGGHPSGYWFKKDGKRIQEVSREAFAGYFEYRVMIYDADIRERLINPYHCLACTKRALESMFDRMLRFTP